MASVADGILCFGHLKSIGQAQNFYSDDHEWYTGFVGIGSPSYQCILEGLTRKVSWQKTMTAFLFMSDTNGQ